MTRGLPVRRLQPRSRSAAPGVDLFPTPVSRGSFRRVPVPASLRVYVDNPSRPSPVPRDHGPDPRRSGSPSTHHPRTLVLAPASRASLRPRPHSPIWLPILALQRSRIPVSAPRAAPAPHSRVSAPMSAHLRPRVQRGYHGCSSREKARMRTATNASVRAVVARTSAKVVHRDHNSAPAST